MRSIVLLPCLWVATPAFAGNDHNAAKTALKSGDVPAAIKAYKALTRSDADDAQAWFMLGTLELGQRKTRRAILHLQMALDKGWYAISGEYNLACAHAVAGDVDVAFERLDRALAAGYGDPAHMSEDADLASLRDDEGWNARIREAELNRDPCHHDARYRAFDFWLGRWNVFDAKGVRIGSNTITSEENGCAVVERWTNVMGKTGRSINYFDPADEQWRQDWVSSTGSVVHYTGGPDDAGAMVLEGTSANAKAPEPVPTRCTWAAQDDGTVTQTFENLGEDGVWTPKMALTYRPSTDDE